MRVKWAKRIAGLGLIFIGTTLLIVAFFAYQLHIDHNQVMGPNRIALAFLGAFFLFVYAGLLLSRPLHRLLKSPRYQKINRLIHWIKFPFVWLFEEFQVKTEPRRRSKAWVAIAGAGLAIFISLWYLTSGRMVVWTPYSAYFNRQANAFLAGQLSLLEKPPAALLALADPYQFQNRTGVGDYIWDSSLYKGKYYLYWGPVPALMAASVKLFHPAWVIEDQYLIFFSIAGLAIVLAALLYWLQKNYFPHIPDWAVMGLTLLSVLNTPVFWLINRPAVYETSIAVGQFFLILGLYTGIRGMHCEKYRVLLMAFTGLFWAAAIGSRVDLGFGIAWMIFLICLFLLIKSGKWRASKGALIALILPLILWGACLAWYNYARFGNILETGHRYQLTGGALPADYRNIVSASYILPNLYNLLARPMEVHWGEFPFFFTPYIRNDMWPKLLLYPRNPNYFYNEPITGIFVSIPTIWFLLFPLIFIPLRFLWNWLKERPATSLSIRDRPLSNWLSWMGIGAVILNLGILSIFIFSTMRYEADLTPLLTILIALSLGWESIIFHSRPRFWRMLLFVVGISMLFSIIIGLLTNFQNGDWIFKNNNPHLYQVIAHLLTGK
jgi:hypothetical protein